MRLPGTTTLRTRTPSKSETNVVHSEVMTLLRRPLDSGMNVDYRTIPQKDLAKFVLSRGGWSKLLCTGEKVRRLVDVALVFVGKEVVPFSARKASGGFAEGIAPFLQLPHFSQSVIKKIARKAKLQRRRQELTQTTPDQPVDDEAVYYKVAGDCPKGCVYSLRSLWRKKRRYVDPDASTTRDGQLYDT
ncbi:hypothetical protein Scep_010336 [Stephania cephalantha]|uniref:Uncharacterized protein n=1 Tax=Stephania cephalantha TaxID=152367 RepID=A0AAP0JX34_9MAGN